MARKNKMDCALQGEYGIAKVYVIIGSVGCVTLLGCGLWLAHICIADTGRDADSRFALAMVSALLIVGVVLGGIGLFKSRFILGADQMTKVGIFGSNTLFFNAIKGVACDGRYLRFVPKEGGGKAMELHYYYQGYGEVKEWARDKFSVLRDWDYERERRKMLHDERFGKSVKERKANAERLKRWIYPLNVLVGVVGVLMFFGPVRWYVPLVTVCTLFPLVAGGIYVCTHGMAKIYTEGDKSPYPSLNTLAFLCPLMLFLHAIFRIHVLDYGPFWPWFAVVTVVMFLFYTCRDIGLPGTTLRSFLWPGAVALICAAAYSYAVVLLYNKILDHDAPTRYRTHVVDKWESVGRHRTYHLLLLPWGTLTEPEEVMVGAGKYDGATVGRGVDIVQYEGAFAIPYYDVDL